MGWGKWILLGLLWIPPFTPIGFLMTYGMANLYLFLFLFGLLVLRPLKWFFSGVSSVESFLQDGVEQVESKPRRSGIVALIFFLLIGSVFRGTFTSLMEGDMVSFLPIGVLLGVTAVFTVLASSFYRKFTEPEAAEVAGTAAGAGGGAAAAAGQHARRAGEMVIEGEEEDFAVAMARSLLEEVPLVDAEVAAEGAVAGLAELAPYIAIALAILLVGELVFLALVYFLFLPAVAGILGGAFGGVFGAAGGYANLFGQQAANQALPGLGQSQAMEQTSAMLSQTAAKIGCFAKGPACFRQWQQNNTERPGSEDVGEQYGLKIERFDIGQGSGLDVAYKDTDYAIPVSFTISNPRHGLKGLNAENVSYRLRVIDSRKEYCDTGWIPVKAYDIREDAREPWKGNDIYPGTSASTGFQRIKGNENGDDFTLEDCNMLQPALGEYRTVMLEVRYDYFSQSTLYFQAMSLQNLQSNPNIEKSMKESKTADTPVKASINVNSPVLYDSQALKEGQSAEDAAQPFAVRASLDTQEFDLRYKVKDLKVRNSQETTIYQDSSRECQFIPSGDNMLQLKQRAKRNIISSASDRALWFTRAQKPPIFGCVMRLEDPSDISPSGETLTMGVEAEYTVALEEKIDSFKVSNSRCSARYDCPLLVTQQYNDTHKDYHYLTRCTGVDAGNGCSVVKGPTEDGDGRSNEWSKQLMTGGRKLDKELEQGEIAFNAGQLPNSRASAEYAIGLDRNTIERMTSGDNKNFALASVRTSRGLDVEFERLGRDAPCTASGLEQKRTDIKKVIIFERNAKKCSGSSGSSGSSDSTWGSGSDSTWGDGSSGWG
ncbi:MAG: hypothetical protein ABEJ64_04230 [Candidatus Nanohaloarchaea archaeon]